MNFSPLSRRGFIASASAGVAAALLPASTRAAATSAASKWPIGCFNRPWTKWSYDATLDSIKAAGYKYTGLLTPIPGQGEVFTGSAAKPEYLAALKEKIAARGLKVNMAALRLKTDLPVADATADVFKQIENCHTVGAEFALTFGEDKPERYEKFYQIMSSTAAFAQERGIKLVMKPHGGGSGSSEEILTAIKTVGHANFKIWYDAGNIIYYTGKDPVEEFKPIAQHVTGFCAKDCGAPKGDVMIQFGAGKVDFTAMFQAMKSAGFNGPLMVECCKIGATAQETTANARANREFLEKILAAV